VAQSAPTSASAGLSAFRFFNLGGGGSSAITSGGDLDSDLTSDEDEPERWNHNMSSLAQSLPFFFGVRDFKCFVCSKQIPADDVEAHIMMCLTKPKLTYNDDILNDNKGECIICFEELEKGQTIARLQCLCIYHKHCIENWLQRSQSCPGHPPD
jgi:E3 ubiquitin-protein ligase ZNRF1/2